MAVTNCDRPESVTNDNEAQMLYASRVPEPQLIVTRNDMRASEGHCSACQSFFSVHRDHGTMTELLEIFRRHVENCHMSATF